MLLFLYYSNPRTVVNVRLIQITSDVNWGGGGFAAIIRGHETPTRRLAIYLVFPRRIFPLKLFNFHGCRSAD